MRRGNLLKNYAHVFAIMMRLRQLCCHRELVPLQWGKINMDEIEKFAAEVTAADAPPEEGAETDENMKKLAEQLRDMIKSGMSDECSICLSEFNHPVITPCAHVYCRNCITEVIDTTRPPPARCPLCRGDVTKGKLLEAAPPEEDEDGEDEADDENFDDLNVSLSSTKVNAVVKAIEMDRKRDPNGKSIIVSQFTSLLSIVQVRFKHF